MGPGPTVNEITGRRDLARWRIPIALAICALAFTWTVLAKVESEGYPGPVLDALGFLLAALVFALGFAQQALKRTLDDALAEARRRDEAIIRAATSGDSPMSTLEVYEQAQLQSIDLDEAENQLRKFGPELATIARRFGEWRAVAAERSSLAWGLAVATRRQTGNPEEQLERRFHELDQKWLSITEISGIRGHMVVAGIAAEGGGAAFEALSVGYVFLVSMWGLALTGSLYSGPATLLAPSIDLWIILTILGLAHAYQRLIRWDMSMSLSRFESRLRALPLTELLHAEGFLTAAGWNVSERGSDTFVDSEKLAAAWSTEVTWRLDRFAPYLQALPWFQSLRGRQHLWRALRAREPCERAVALAEAKHYLRDATTEDRNPIALLALARTLEEMSPRLSDECGEEAQEAAELAAQVTVLLAPELLARSHREQDSFSPTLFIAGTNYANYLVRNQLWCWPKDSRIQHGLREALHLESPG